MIQNYISESRLKVTIGRFIKTSFWLSLILYVVELLFSLAMIFWKPTIFFTNTQLGFIAIINFVPVFLFVFSFYIYENFYFLKTTNIWIRIKSLVWIFYLIIPNLILLYRFTDFIQNNKLLTIIPIVGTTIFWLFGGNWETNNFFKTIRVFKDIKYIMYNFWIKQDAEYEKNHFEDTIIKERGPFYVNKKGIEIFQKTISCPAIDAQEAFEFGINSLTGSISVLDIGGAEGNFTFNLLDKYKKAATSNTITKIQYVEPVTLFENYKNKLKTIVTEADIYNQQSPYESWSPAHTEKYDLIIASHSLYSAIDNNKATTQTLISKLKSNKANNGKILIVMASREGRAYSFKKHALKILFGDVNPDVDANLLKDNITESYTSKLVDNYIDLTDFINEYDNDNSDNLKEWISYFLRVDSKNLKGQNFARIVKLLKYYIQPLHELGDSEISKFTAAACPKALDKNNSKVLPHKTEIIII